jgi:hypothetical protein
MNNAWQIKQLYPNAVTGWYEIQGYYIWCDMTSDGGGWMLVANIGLDSAHVTRDALNGDVVPGASESSKFHDDFINQLRSNSTYSGNTPWRATATNFDVFPDAPDVTVPDRLRTQTQFINAAMTEFNAEAQAMHVHGATWMHINYEHPYCMKLKYDERTIGFGDRFKSGDTYFSWADADIMRGFSSHNRNCSPGSLWVK